MGKGHSGSGVARGLVWSFGGTGMNALIHTQPFPVEFNEMTGPIKPISNLLILLTPSTLALALITLPLLPSFLPSQYTIRGSTKTAISPNQLTYKKRNKNK